MRVMRLVNSLMVFKTEHTQYHHQLSDLLFEVANSILISIREEVEDLVFDVILF